MERVGGRSLPGLLALTLYATFFCVALAQWSPGLHLPKLPEPADSPSALPFGIEDSDEYDKGRWGLYPDTRFQTELFSGPHLLRKKWGPECEIPGHYLFFAPRGMIVGHPGPAIMGQDGQLIWHSESWPTTYGLTVQKYRGEKYLTFWSGNDQVIGHGSGNYFMLDKHYNQYKMLDADGLLTGDLHEFKITKDNTMIVTSYDAVIWDLSPLGRDKDGWIWECYFQEIDIETGKLIFQWKATDHFTFDDCYNPVRFTGVWNNPWDWFHINSVDKDNEGNYLISARYSHALTLVNGKTGEIMWHIGGKRSDFRDLSDGRATNFAWQHDARWEDDYKAITLFDNSAYFADQDTPARGLKIAVDKMFKTVKVILEAKHPDKYISESQGSTQQLPNGNLLVGYGSAAGFSQFDGHGNLVCDAQFAALHFHKDGSFSPGAAMSYRTYMHEWKGFPTQLPKVKFTEDNIYASWNGATELRSWGLEASSSWGSSERDWKRIGFFDRTGFESNMTIGNPRQHRMYRLTALDEDDHSLGQWVVYSSGEIKELPLPETSLLRSVLLVLFGAAITLVTSSVFRRRKDISSFIRRRRSNSLASWSSDDEDSPGFGAYRNSNGKTGDNDVESVALVRPTSNFKNERGFD